MPPQHANSIGLSTRELDALFTTPITRKYSITVILQLMGTASNLKPEVPPFTWMENGISVNFQKVCLSEKLAELNSRRGSLQLPNILDQHALPLNKEPKTYHGTNADRAQ